MLLVVSLGLALLSYVNCHSWLTCTDYLEENGDYWDVKLCRAFPRHANRFAHRDSLFGQDTGYNINNPPAAAPCRTSRDDASYDEGHPMAVYYPGQRIVISHPTKNHVADVRCTNKYIPDNGNYIYAGPRNANTDVSLGEFKKNLVVDLGVSPFGYEVSDQTTMTYPKPGFQNAPKFCENPDKALATFAFDIPADFQPGRYTFLWAWYFNGPTDLYTGCWEADIVATKSERDAILRRRGQTTNKPVNVANGGRVEVSTTRRATLEPTKATVEPSSLEPTRATVEPSSGTRVDGGWSKFTTWGACSVSCGDGTQTRVRHCDSPMPQNGGRYCEGSNEEVRRCILGQCQRGDWSELKVTFTSQWGSGANAQIITPPNKPTREWKIVLEFSCKPSSINVWHADDVTPESERVQGRYWLKQTGWQLSKPDIGFTVQFPFDSQCTRRAASDIKLTVVYT